MTSYSQGIIDLWHEREAEHLSPDMQVTTVRQFGEQWKDIGLLFDYAYIDSSSARRNCWWLSNPQIREDCKTEAMTLGDYMRLHLKECSGMNPFWSLGRVEFFTKFKLLNPNFKL